MAPAKHPLLACPVMLPSCRTLARGAEPSRTLITRPDMCASRGAPLAAWCPAEGRSQRPLHGHSHGACAMIPTWSKILPLLLVLAAASLAQPHLYRVAVTVVD